MNWTPDRPTKPGNYWLSLSIAVREVFKAMKAAMTSLLTCTLLAGQWRDVPRIQRPWQLTAPWVCRSAGWRQKRRRKGKGKR